jgi:hypothetical protein
MTHKWIFQRSQYWWTLNSLSHYSMIAALFITEIEKFRAPGLVSAFRLAKKLKIEMAIQLIYLNVIIID